jgi:hypothetical protein
LLTILHPLTIKSTTQPGWFSEQLNQGSILNPDSVIDCTEANNIQGADSERISGYQESSADHNVRRSRQIRPLGPEAQVLQTSQQC